MKENKGVSLITLIIVTVVVVILASAVIITLTTDNTSDSNKISNLAESRVSLNSAMLNYTSKSMSKTEGTFTVSELLLGKDNSGTSISDIVPVVDDTTKLFDTEFYKVSPKVEEILGVKIPKYSGADWYVNIKTGNFYLIYSSDKSTTPNWMYSEENKKNADSTLAQFVMYVDDGNVKNISE